MRGALIGHRYELEELLGKGGAAEVWKARDAELDVRRAIKILTAKAATRQTMRRRLKAEARALARLNHPHVLRVLDIGVDDSRPYLVMELLPGGSVSDVVRRDGPMAPERAITITLEVLSALAVAHGQGIIHRDIKPQNILLDGEGHAVVADFGIALVESGERKTRTGVAMGSFAFMPPEQRVDAKRVGPSADLYATGCTLFWMVTGRTPVDLFTDEDDAPRWEVVPEALRPILRWATAAEPDERPQTAAELAEALRSLAPIEASQRAVLDPASFPAPRSTMHGPTTKQTATPVPAGPADAAMANTATPYFLVPGSEDDDSGFTAGETHVLPTAVPTEQEPEEGSRRGVWLLLLSLLVLLIVLGLVAWRFMGPLAAAPRVEPALELPVDSSELVETPTIEEALAAVPAPGTPDPDVGRSSAPESAPSAPVEVEAGASEPGGAQPLPARSWTGSFDGHPMDVQLTGSADALRGNVRVSLGGNGVDTPVTGRWDAERSMLVLVDEVEAADAGRYRAELRGGRLHGTFEAQHPSDMSGEPRILPFTLRPVVP